MTNNDRDKLVSATIDKVTAVLQDSGVSFGEALGVLSFVNGYMLHQGFMGMYEVEESEDKEFAAQQSDEDDFHNGVK